MKNLYNFKNQIAHIDEICQTNILAAEIANSYLRKMCPQLIRRICQEVKKECEEEYHNDEERMQSVKQALNLLKREQVTNVDVPCLRCRNYSWISGTSSIATTRWRERHNCSSAENTSRTSRNARSVSYWCPATQPESIITKPSPAMQSRKKPQKTSR